MSFSQQIALLFFLPWLIAGVFVIIRDIIIAIIREESIIDTFKLPFDDE